jgi:voltage-gated sodium channel
MLSAFDDIPENISRIFALTDQVITGLFIIELIVKISEWGLRNYLSSKWNIFDFILILISIPAFISWIFDLSLTGLGFFLVFRVLRVFKSFRFIKFVPGMKDLIKGIQRALKTSMIILLGFSIYLFIIGILSCYLYRNIDPDNFGDPLKSFYSIFRIFTMEGWSDIPGTISESSTPIIGVLTKVYFIFIVISGGILGISLVNSIFVEAMLTDNTNDIQEKVDEINRKLDRVISEDKKVLKG